MQPIFRWNGEYFGFLDHGGCLFDAAANFLGWQTEDHKVWRANGTFLGELVDGAYVLRHAGMATPQARPHRAQPAKPQIPARHANRAAKGARAGYSDALDEFRSGGH